DVTLLRSRHIKEFRLRVVGWRHPVRGPSRSRTNAIPFRSGRSIFGGYRRAARILFPAPGNLGVGIGADELPGAAIDHIEKPVAVGLQNQLLAGFLFAARGRTVDHDGDLRGGVVVLVVAGRVGKSLDVAGGS